MVFMPPSHYHIINQGGVYDVFLQCMQSSELLGFIEILITYLNNNEFSHIGYLYSFNKRKVACLPVPSTIPLF